MLGPYMSVSRIPVCRPCWARARARFTAIVDLPTPPLALETAITFWTLGMGRFSGRPGGDVRFETGGLGGGEFDRDGSFVLTILL